MAKDTIMTPNRNPFSSDRVVGATITATPESSNARTVSIPLMSPRKKQISGKVSVFTVYLSDAATGIGLCAAAPSGGVIAGANGQILNPPVAGKMFVCQSDATGLMTLTVTEATIKTFYVCVVLPDSTLVAPFALAYA